ncbi:hypothetical protein Kpol_1023p62 [Vanderwaltozyma polyspora DSM 70294]|uniref:DUF3020 domain-containing protein n=1 Tax=Vanderwaltozyma polyspora (strain ATCC 22028 / DSM 70294 / BCRC 21397 / CBS 2163 / NBRC 10782 / NRRL Y-8283 / UCD 57-17) TaxID=436907 RepID=A7TFT5_VANPO|nr:uncharacterized protein Kpol_1023p62 [Vanderwaltozyma polyspora DSM 70294]EDO18893.1 hypothetical protein Kpol_1023p62 [Vanderwaltozyma polyspora DSM 70294]
MSEGHSEDEINFNELVGNLLSTHNELTNEGSVSLDDNDKNTDILNVHDDVELPDFGNDDVDLAAVASAIETLDDTKHNDINENNDLNDNELQENQDWAQALQQGISQLVTSDEPLNDTQPSEQLDQDDENLRNAILESLQQLDGEPETTKPAAKTTKPKKQATRRKKNEKPKEPSLEKEKKKPKQPAKSKRKKKEPVAVQDEPNDNLLNFEDVIKGFIQQGHDEGTVEEDKDESDDLETRALVEATLKAFEKELLGTTPKPKQSRKTATKKKPAKQATVPKTKEITVAKTSKKLDESKAKSKTQEPKSKSKSKVTDASKKRKKKEKKQSEDILADSYDDDDFSRALAEMVNQVVNTSLNDEVQEAKTSRGKKKVSKTPVVSKQTKTKQNDELNNELLPPQEENFDLNQIMQKAMALAFQEQNNEAFDASTVEEFNRGLGDFGVSDLLTPYDHVPKKKTVSKKKRIQPSKPSIELKEPSIKPSVPSKSTTKTKSKKVITKEPKPRKLKEHKESKEPKIPKTPKTTKATKIPKVPKSPKLVKVSKVPKSVKKTKKPKAPKLPKVKKVKTVRLPRFPRPSKQHLTRHDLVKKQYLKLAKEASSIARKRNRDNIRTIKLKLKQENERIREDRKLKKDEEKEKLELERKELEEIVAKGPPYPLDLRVTKSGIPKKPYRRWTPEEIAIRATMPPPEPKKPKKIKKQKKKKAKKLKKVPLSALKKIPLFNFTRDNIDLSNGEKKLHRNNLEGGIPDLRTHRKRVDLSVLAPPSSINPNQVTKLQSDSISTSVNENRTNFVSLYDPSIKTVVRKEKFPFHPPWIVPQNPPYSLPVARRKSKRYSDKLATNKKTKSKKLSKHSRQSFIINNRNSIVPAILFPIVKTLKAAARAKVASGVSPEEATRHLMTIIQHTKKSIAQTLTKSRRNAFRDYRKIKTEDDIDTVKSQNSAIRRIPIFSLSSIKKVNTKDDVNNNKPSVIKLENENSEKLLTLQQKLPEASHDEGNGLNEVNTKINDNKIGSQDSQIVESSQIEESNILNKNELRSDVRKDIKKTNELSTAVVNSTNNNTLNNIETLSDIGLPKISAIVDDNDGTNANKDVVKNVVGLSKVSAVKDTDIEELKESNIDSHSINNKLQDIEISSEIIKIDDEKETPKTTLEFQDNNTSESLKNKRSNHVGNIIETLVKQEIDKSNTKDEDNISLPPSFTNIISNAITNLLPTINDTVSKLETSRKRTYTRPPAPILNLDGLVPPSPGFIKKVEQDESILLDTSFDESLTDGTPKKIATYRRKTSSEQPTALNKTKFNIPSNNAGYTKRSTGVKFARLYLNANEMSILTKEINKERKRKWRNANIVKNWENDVRARLKKRSKTDFIDLTQDEKDEWVEVEFAKRKVEFTIKNEEINGIGADSTSGSSNITENEILNMIANILNREDVARRIEKDLIEDSAKGTNRKRKRSSEPPNVVSKQIKIDDTNGSSDETSRISVSNDNNGSSIDLTKENVTSIEMINKPKLVE